MLKLVRRNFGAAPACVVALLCSGPLLAQPAAEEDDLEIPSTAPASPSPPRPAPLPSAPAPEEPETPEEAPATDDYEVPAQPNVPVPPAADVPPPAPVPPPAVPPPAAVAHLPATAAAGRVATAEPAQSSVAAAAVPRERTRPAVDTGNLELTAHSRPVPLGLVLSGFLQAQYGLSQLSEDQLQQDGQPLNRDEFTLRAARLRVDGGHTYTAYTLELDASTTNGPQVGVRRAEATLLYRGDGAEEDEQPSRPPLVALTAGITDLPFGYELVEASRTRFFLERTAASEALFPTQMDIGVKVHGAYRGLRYAVAVVNGEPVLGTSSLRDRNAAKDVVGRFGLDLPVGGAFAISGGTSFAFGKGFHPGQVAVKDTVTWRDDNNDGVAIPNEIIGVPGSAAIPSESFERWALGLDLQLSATWALGATRLALEAYVASNHDRALFVSDPVALGFDARQLGAYAALTQDVTRYGVLGFRIAAYDPNLDNFEERRGDFVPHARDVLTLSPLVGLVLPGRARLLFQYDMVRDHFARDAIGVPTDAENDQLAARLQVEL
jgi:hypothetical protein